MSVFNKILKVGEGKRVRQLAELVAPINELSDEMAAMSDEELREQTDIFRKRLADGESLDDILIPAFAVVREAATRVLGQRHYDVQLMGGMALHFGWIAEMKTGEGKTLVSTLPVYLNALSGRGIPCGGIASTRILRMTFSQTSAFSGTFARSALCSDSPPVFSLSL